MASSTLFTRILALILVSSFRLTVPCAADETVPVTVDTVPSGLQVSVDEAAFTAPHVFQWTPLSCHTLGAPSPQGGLGTQHLFEYWSSGGAQYHTVCTPYSPISYTAHFITRHELTTPVNLSGGRARPDCGGGCWYDSGQRVSLVALPDSGYAFDHWAGDCTGTNPSVSVVMTSPKTCEITLSQCGDYSAPSPVQIGIKGYPTFKAAYEEAAQNDIVKVRATTLLESLELDRQTPVTLRGGYTCDYTSNPSYTLLQGHVIVTSGASTIENMIILSGTPPVITSFSATPGTVPAGSPATLSWAVADAATVTIENAAGPFDPIHGTAAVTPQTTTIYTLTATNPYGQDTAQVTVTATALGITTFKAVPDVISSGGSSRLKWEVSGATSVVIDQGIGEVNPESGTEGVSVSPLTTTTYTITVTNAMGTKTKTVTVGVIPTLIAPPVDQTVATTVHAASSFLYTGPTPVQTGMAPETIELKRAAVLRGKVLKEDGSPLPGVTVTMLNHPEYGQTITRDDGMFDLVVNGGGIMNVRYTKTDYLTVQRQEDVPWQDFMRLPEVRMIKADPNVTFVDLTSQSDFQVVRGSVVTDDRGTRQSTVLIPRGTRAWMVFPDGHEEEITSMTVRATEFTAGPDGEAKMPAELPPTSAYTYCEEFSVEEAIEAGAPEVRFSQMAVSYNENFLNFPVGTGIPLGAYDRERGVWIPSDNGKVIKIVSITNGLAELDTDGNGTIDNGVSLGVTDAERRQVALLYPVGQSLWRVPVPHFTNPWDKNMGVGCDGGCEDPDFGSPLDKKPKCTKKKKGSVIECQTQVLAESLPVTGTPFRLHYTSDRVFGRVDNRRLEIPLTKDSTPSGMKQVFLKTSVAGITSEVGYAPATNMSETFLWDGRDAYGREIQGSWPATVWVGYGYNLSYATTSRFGYNGNGTPITITQNLFTLWQKWDGFLGSLDPRGQGLGGWTLNVHHAYDPVSHTLYQGDGERRDARSVGNVIATFTRVGGSYIAVGPDGSIYLSLESMRVARITQDGAYSIVAGGGSSYAEGIPATSANLMPLGLAVGPDGSLYIATRHTVRRVGPDGIINTFAGTGYTGFSGDGGPATSAQMKNPAGVAVGPDGSVYIADTGNSRIRRVGADGIIDTVLFVSDNLPFSAEPKDVAVGPDGSVYAVLFAGHKVIRIRPDGSASTFAGTGVRGFSGDGGPATDARLYYPQGVSVAPDGTVYIADSYINRRIRRVGTDGIITTFAGTGGAGTCVGDGGPPANATFSTQLDVAVGPDGGVYITDFALSSSGYKCTRRVGWPMPGLSGANSAIPSSDGSELYLFDKNGRHLQTLDAMTGAVRYEFAYDAAGRLSAVTDLDGNVTTISRDDLGNPTAIVGPFGQQTELGLDAEGYLSSVQNPSGETVRLGYGNGGLLTALTDPRGQVHRYTYDTLGRLVKDEDPAGGWKSLDRLKFSSSYQVDLSTAMGRRTRYFVENLSNGDERHVDTYPDGTAEGLLIGANSSYKQTPADGTVLDMQLGPDPRFGMQAPLASTASVTAPSGLKSTMTSTRTAALSNPQNPLTLTSLSDTLSVNGRNYTTAYSATTRKYTLTTPAGRQGTVTIDAKGRVIEEKEANLEPVSYTYDSLGRLATTTVGSGAAARTASFTYNTGGYLASVTDPLGWVTGYGYDSAGRVTSQTFPDGTTVFFGYDANGNVTAVTPPGRPAHAFSYNPVDLMSEYNPPDVGLSTDVTRYAFNLDRQATGIVRPDGVAIDFGYDSGGRLATITDPGGQTVYTYHESTGVLTGITAPEGNTLSYNYDGLLVVAENSGGAVTGSVDYTFDNNLRVTGISVNGTNAIGYQYNNDSLITKAGDLTLTRNAQNGLIAGTALGGVSDTLAYNTFGELTGYSASYGGVEKFKQEFTYDKLGRITQKIETVLGAADTYDYTYDAAGRLSTVTKNGSLISTYTYDANGNRLSHATPGGTTTGTYDDQDRLTQYGTATYTYTANGELLSRTTSGLTTQYSYDVFGNLKSVTLPNFAQVEYAVDGRDRRIGKKVNGTWIHKFLYSGKLKPVAELNASNEVISRFVYGSRTNVPDYMVKAGVTYRIVSDHLGSPRLVINTADGTVIQQMDYDEFGNVTADSNPGFQPFGFAGGLYDPDTKLVRFGARDYDAVTGRWTSKDPGGFSGGPNLYGYAYNDPVNLIDPFGNAPDGWDNIPTQVTPRPGTPEATPRGGTIRPNGTWWPSDNPSGEINTPTPAKPAGSPPSIPKTYPNNPPRSPEEVFEEIRLRDIKRFGRDDVTLGRRVRCGHNLLFNFFLLMVEEQKKIWREMEDPNSERHKFWDRVHGRPNSWGGYPSYGR